MSDIPEGTYVDTKQNNGNCGAGGASGVQSAVSGTGLATTRLPGTTTGKPVTAAPAAIAAQGTFLVICLGIFYLYSIKFFHLYIYV